MNNLVLFLISSAPVILLGAYIYMKDKNKEPLKLLLKLFLGGIFSCFLVLFFSYILESLFPFFKAAKESLNLFELLIYVFVKIALIEESCKWLVTYIVSYNNTNLDEIYDAIVYSVFVALGFAFLENLIYVYSGGISIGILRALLAVPGHACDGIFMGFHLGLAKQSSLNNRRSLTIKNLILSILSPVILHGIYDYCLFTKKPIFILVFFIFVIAIYIVSIKKVKRMSSIKVKMKYKYNYCSNCGYIVNSNYCPRCGRKNE